MFRSRDAFDALALGRGAGVAFRPRRVAPAAAAADSTIRVGGFECPILKDQVTSRGPLHVAVTGNKDKVDVRKDLYADFCCVLGPATPVRQDSRADPMRLEPALPPQPLCGEERSPRRDVDIDLLSRSWGDMQLPLSPKDPMRDEARVTTGWARLVLDPLVGSELLLSSAWALPLLTGSPARVVHDELGAVWPVLGPCVVSPALAFSSPTPDGAGASPAIAAPGPLSAIRMAIREHVALPIATPLIKGRPTLRAARARQSVGSPRRSVRLASKPKAANPTVQAQNVLMVKLGLAECKTAVDEETAKRYEATFATPLTQSKHDAFQVLFNDGPPLFDQASEVDRVLPSPQ